MPTPSRGQSSLEVLLPLLLALLKMALAVAQIARSLPRSAGPSREQSVASRWHGTAPPSPGMLPSQSHSHLVNGLINILKGPLLDRAGVHPLLCLAASLLSLSSAMVRRMPFPRGREIHGLLPCSKGEEATSHHETQTGAELSLSGGKAAEASPCPCWATHARPWHWPSRSPSGRCRRCTGLHLPLSVTSMTNALQPKLNHHPFPTRTKEPMGDGETAEALQGGGHSQSEQLPRPHQDLSTAQLPAFRRFKTPQGCFLKTSPFLNLRMLPLPRTVSPEWAEPQGAEPELTPALELHCAGRQLPTEDTNASLLQPAAPNNRREPTRLVSMQAYFANNEDVGEPGGKAIAIGVLHVNHVE